MQILEDEFRRNMRMPKHWQMLSLDLEKLIVLILNQLDLENKLCWLIYLDLENKLCSLNSGVVDF